MTTPGDERRAARVTAGLLAMATLALAGAVAVYVTTASTQWLGALGGAGFLAGGAGLVRWANGLLDTGPHAEDRTRLVATAPEQAALTSRLERGDGLLTRRVWLRRSALVAGATAAAAVVAPLASLGPAPRKRDLRTSWGPGVRLVTVDGRPVLAERVPLDGLLTVFPEPDQDAPDSAAILVRVDATLLRLPAARATWAPGGIVAFSKICTHAGCPVGLYQAESHQLLCPCHQSSFDVLRAAKPVSGPAAWPLPQLPLAIDADGHLTATADLSAPVGAGWWKR